MHGKINTVWISVILSIIIKGFIIGFSIAAPVGPIGVLCMNRSLRYGFLNGFFTGLGAAVADGFYGAVVGFGITSISHFLLRFNNVISGAGALFLLYIGIRIFRDKPSESLSEDKESKGMFINFIETFFLTITNPMTIIMFTAVITGIGFKDQSSAGNYAFNLIFGVFLGSACWWLFLSYITSIFKSKLRDRNLIYINRISGVVVSGFSIFLLSKLFIY